MSQYFKIGQNLSFFFHFLQNLFSSNGKKISPKKITALESLEAKVS